MGTFQTRSKQLRINKAAATTGHGALGQGKKSSAVPALNTDDKKADSLGVVSTSGPVQRVIHGVPAFQVFGRASLGDEAQDRLDGVIATLVTMLHNDPGIQLQKLVISIEREGAFNYQGNLSTIVGDNPAETTTFTEGAEPNPTIRITIQRPFAEMATKGELLGMLAHEIGVHNIPSDFKGIHDDAVTNWAPIHTTRKTDKANTPSGGYEFNNWPNPGMGMAPPSRECQRPHELMIGNDIIRHTPGAVFAAYTGAE